jgi:DNA modification methylase
MVATRTEFGKELLSAEESLALIDAEDAALLSSFGGSIKVETSFTRHLVSNQANKSISSYRWYKYREAFSAPLIDSLLERYSVSSGPVFDPFAGSGTALFRAASCGINVDGIELLPIGQHLIETKYILERVFTTGDFQALRRWLTEKPWCDHAHREPLLSLRITHGAYPSKTLESIEKYLSCLNGESENVQKVLKFALLCILESISFTRKDGQYLRWDYRAGKRQGASQFDKGKILSFEEAILEKLSEILEDAEGGKPTSLFDDDNRCEKGTVHLMCGSCLDILPEIEEGRYEAIITSPPYCNRYDYTRTYALELALLGIGEAGVVELRQQMLSCTVENKAKDLIALQPSWERAVSISDSQKLLHRILEYLENEKTRGTLNNTGIPRMIRGYFYEMACVIQECYRVLKPEGVLVMVNDNVRYSGASISVDLILSDMARSLGFEIENILVLPNGKGNSSQQMGEHGREALRKCVYVWRKK